jgi:hypothetical protein
MVLLVLLRRQANWFVLAEVAAFVETVAKMFGAMEVELTVATVGAATLGSADGFVRVFAGGRQRSHAPARHSRHNKIQMNGRERISIGQMIISQNRHQSEDAYRRWLAAVGPRCRAAIIPGGVPTSRDRAIDSTIVFIINPAAKG